MWAGSCPGRASDCERRAGTTLIREWLAAGRLEIRCFDSVGFVGQIAGRSALAVPDRTGLRGTRLASLWPMSSLVEPAGESTGGRACKARGQRRSRRCPPYCSPHFARSALTWPGPERSHLLASFRQMREAGNCERAAHASWGAWDSGTAGQKAVNACCSWLLAVPPSVPRRPNCPGWSGRSRASGSKHPFGCALPFVADFPRLRGALHQRHRPRAYPHWSWPAPAR